MEAIWVFMVILALVFAVVLIISQAQDRISRLNRAYMQLANKYRGNFQAGGLLSYPKARFVYNGDLITLEGRSTGNKSEPYHTLLRMRWPDSRIRCEVQEENMPHFALRLMGMEDIQTGDVEFDRDFRVTGSSRKDVCQLLHDGVRLIIQRLRATGGKGIHFSIRRGEMLIRSAELIYDPESLQEFVRWGLVLRDQALLVRSSGITFLEGAAAEADREIICLVCGEEIRHDMVYCRKCETPHHRDCWYYFGACSTYGCQEKHFHEGDSSLRAPRSSRKRQPR